MAGPERDPRVTDLRRYRRERERAKRAAPRPPRGQREPLLGARPRAGLILVLVLAVLVAMWLLQGRH